jgi:hypothetical protein
MWLFQKTTDPFNPASTDTGGFNFGEKFESDITSALDPKRIEKFFLTLEDNAKSLNTKVANGLQANLKTIESTIFEVYKEGLDYGFAYGDAAEYIQAISDGSQKLFNITTENVKSAVMLSKAMGITAKEVGAMYSNIMKMGMGQQKANEIIDKTFKMAREYGVNASVLTKTVSENIFKAQAYGFKDGINGLREMAIQAQRVGVSMEIAAGAADKAFSPEGAIEMASNLQMLGGNMGGLTDFHSLMYMAQSDTGALQDQILKTTSSMVDFNSKSGEFRINPEMRRNLTQYAESIGSTYDKVAEGAIKFRKEQEIMSRIPISAGFSESDKSIISAMAEIGPNGSLQVKLPGMETMTDVSGLTLKNIKELEKELDNSNKTTDEIAKDQLSVQDKMAKTLEEIRNAGIFGTGIDKGLEIPTKINDSLISAAQNFNTTLVNGIITADLGQKVVDLYGATLTKVEKIIEDFTSNLQTKINKIITDMETKISTSTSTVTPTPPEEEGDIFAPPGNRTVVTGSFGSFMGDKRDATLLMPENDMESLFSAYSLVNKMSTEMIKPLPMKELSKSEPIEKYVENKITTENKITNEVNIGGKSELEISLKTPDNNSEKILSLLINNPELKETVMATINERLSKEYSEQLVNVLSRS